MPPVYLFPHVTAEADSTMEKVVVFGAPQDLDLYSAKNEWSSIEAHSSNKKETATSPCTYSGPRGQCHGCGRKKRCPQLGRYRSGRARKGHGETGG